MRDRKQKIEMIAHFAAVVCLLGTPAHAEKKMNLGFSCSGLFTVLWAKQSEISLSWIFGFLVFGVIRAEMKGIPIARVLAPLLGPGILLFSFHMISDPATTPKTRSLRFAFGITVAAIDAVLRYHEIPSSPLFALLMTAAAVPFIRDYEEGKMAKVVPFPVVEKPALSKASGDA